MTPYYEDASVRLFLGDCREILPQIEQVDHVITDPPYARDVYVRMSQPNTKVGSGTPARIGVALKGENWTKRQGAALQVLAAGDIGSIDEMLEDVAEHIARITRRWAVVFSDVETCWRWRDALTAAANDCDCEGGDQGDGLCAIPHEPHCASLRVRRAMRYVRTGAWVKPNAMPQMSGDRPAVGFEPATICHTQGPMRWNGGGRQAVWTYGTSSGSKRPDHPCPKPLELMVHLVSDFTDEGDLILDPFAGSGTTGVAAKRLGRRAILIEREEKYCEVAAKRLQQGALALWEPAAEVAVSSGDLFTDL